MIRLLEVVRFVTGAFSYTGNLMMRDMALTRDDVDGLGLHYVSELGRNYRR